MAGALNEHVFQIRLADRDGVDLAGKSLHQLGHELVTLAALQPDPAVEHSGSDSEFLSDTGREFVGIRRAEKKNIAADLAAQIDWSAEGHNLAEIQDRQAVTPLG